MWGILVVLCGALFLDALDVSMVGVALPSIRTDLGLSTASLQWVVSGYVLGYGGLLLLGGRAADLLGRRASVAGGEDPGPGAGETPLPVATMMRPAPSDTKPPPLCQTPAPSLDDPPSVDHMVV